MKKSWLCPKEVLHLCENRHGSSLLLDEKFSFFGKEIFYRAGDELPKYCTELGVHLRSREADLFSMGNTLLLNDRCDQQGQGKD